MPPSARRGGAVLALVLFACCVAPSDMRSIEVTMQAPWSSSGASPLLEAAEFFGDEGAGDYWAYLEALCGGFGDAGARGKISGASEGPYASAGGPYAAASGGWVRRASRTMWAYA